MLNIIKADLYRIFKGKGIYITFIFFIAIIVLQIYSGSLGAVGVNTDTVSSYDNIKLTGAIAPFATSSFVDNYLYYLLPIIVIIAAVDFGAGTVKNILSNGVSRIKYYFSKLILAFIASTVMLFLNVVLSILLATMINGFGGEFNAKFISDILRVLLPQLYLFFAMSSVGIFLTFSTKRVGALSGYYIGFCLVPMILVYILSIGWPNALKLLDYDIVSNLRMLGGIVSFSNTDLARVYLLGSFYILVSTIGGLLLFRRSEIK